jgi:hypothetical protein
LSFELFQEVAPYGGYVVGVAIFEHAVQPVSYVSGPCGYCGALNEGEGQRRSAKWGADEYIAPVEAEVLFQAIQESVGVSGVAIEEFGWGSHKTAIVTVPDHVVVVIAPATSTASSTASSTISVAVVSVAGVVVRSLAYSSAIERTRGFPGELLSVFLGCLVVVFSQLQELLFHFSNLLVRPVWGEGLMHDGVWDTMVTGRSEFFGHFSDDRGNMEWW